VRERVAAGDLSLARLSQLAVDFERYRGGA
jgi:hypothetical protein